MARPKSTEGKSAIRAVRRKPKSPQPKHQDMAAPPAEPSAPGHFDWANLSLEAVDEIIAAAEKRRDELRRQAEAALLAEFEARAAKLGKSLSDLVNPGGKRDRDPPRKRQAANRPDKAAKAPAAVRFRGPDGQTWSGRGPTPRWLKDLEANGKARAEFAV